MKRLLPITLLLLATSLALADATQKASGIEVSGSLSKPGSWTVDRIKSELTDQIKSIDYTTKGDKHAANAVPLLSLLKASGLTADLKMDTKANPKTKNLPLRMIVVVQGTDGYTVTFSLAELLGDIGAKDVWVCIDADGKPLADKDGPVRLVVPSDAKPGRWVHAVSKISVIDPTAATSQPAN